MRETRSQIVAHRIRTLSSTRDNIHYFEAGNAGARGLDITTAYGGDGSFSFVAFQPDKPKDPTTIGQASINVHDVEKAVAFYRDTLGMRFLFQAGPKMAFFDCGGARLMLAVAEKPEFDHPGSIFYFKVADIQAVAATLQVPRRAVRRSAPPARRHARSRSVDGLLPRRGRQPASADERRATGIVTHNAPTRAAR